MRTALLLLASNMFMTFAWYGHLRFKHIPLWQAILASWGIALFEYCLMVPANRFGHGAYSAAQLKGLQEVITLLVFCGFSLLYLREPIRWNHAAGFVLIVVAAYIIFMDADGRPAGAQATAAAGPAPALRPSETTPR